MSQTFRRKDRVCLRSDGAERRVVDPAAQEFRRAPRCVAVSRHTVSGAGTWDWGNTTRFRVFLLMYTRYASVQLQTKCAAQEEECGISRTNRKHKIWCRAQSRALNEADVTSICRQCLMGIACLESRMKGCNAAFGGSVYH